MNNGLERIRQGYQSLKPSEQKAASYILNHPERILDMAIAELAKETSVSEATIIRMCRSLYFNFQMRGLTPPSLDGIRF